MIAYGILLSKVFRHPYTDSCSCEQYKNSLTNNRQTDANCLDLSTEAFLYLAFLRSTTGKTKSDYLMVSLISLLKKCQGRLLLNNLFYL